jgi:hypothetical protein
LIVEQGFCGAKKEITPNAEIELIMYNNLRAISFIPKLCALLYLATANTLRFLFQGFNQ